MSKKIYLSLLKKWQEFCDVYLGSLKINIDSLQAIKNSCSFLLNLNVNLNDGFKNIKLADMRLKNCYDR